MTRKELIIYMAEKESEGWVTHSALLAIYQNDDDEIPDHFVDVICHLPIQPQPIIIMMGSGMAEKMDQMLKDFINPPENE